MSYLPPRLALDCPLPYKILPVAPSHLDFLLSHDNPYEIIQQTEACPVCLGTGQVVLTEKLLRALIVDMRVKENHFDAMLFTFRLRSGEELGYAATKQALQYGIETTNDMAARALLNAVKGKELSVKTLVDIQRLAVDLAGVDNGGALTSVEQVFDAVAKIKAASGYHAQPPPEWIAATFQKHWPGPELSSGDEVVKALTKAIPGLQGATASCPACRAGEPLSVPACPCESCTPRGPQKLVNVVVHLNDAHRWTRGQVADWLETLDVDLTFQAPKEKEDA